MSPENAYVIKARQINIIYLVHMVFLGKRLYKIFINGRFLFFILSSFSYLLDCFHFKLLFNISFSSMYQNAQLYNEVSNTHISLKKEKRRMTQNEI